MKLIIPNISYICDPPRCIDLKEVYWWNEMKKDIAKFVAEFPNYQQIKIEHQRPGDLDKDILAKDTEIPT